MNVEFSVAELEVMAAALMRTRFDGDDMTPYLGSPALAAAHHRIVDAVVAGSERAGEFGRAERWRTWRVWHNRARERAIVREYAASCAVWAEWSVEVKTEFLRDCCAPFELDEGELRELRESVDARHRAGA